MNNIVYDNAYGVLGLLPNASQKEISRRLKEIEKLISIEEMPSYEFDYDIYAKERTLQSIHDAFLNISNVNTQLLHHFFRVYANSEKQTEILKNIENEFTYENIIGIYESTNKKSFIFDKNIAIVLTLLLIADNAENAEEIAAFCIDIWHSLIYDEKYIRDFKKIFLLDDELGINEAILDNIEDKLITELTKVFSDISRKYSNNQILSMFIEKFKLNNNIFNIDIVEEIYSNIQKNIETMDSMDISADGVFDDQEKALLKNCLGSFQNDFNKLIDLGLYENEKTVILRDLVATKIRIQILDLFNNLEEDETALNLMKFAIYIVGTEGLKEKLLNELNIIKKYSNPFDTIIINKNTTIKLFNKYIKINEKQISFDEVQSVSFLLHTTRTNGIETERTYYFEIGTENNVYNLTQYTGILTNKKEAEKKYYKLVNLANYIVPIISQKLYDTLMHDKTLQINTLYLKKDCYYIRKWNGDRYVKISKNLKKPIVKQGEVILFDEAGCEFFKCSLNSSNACVLLDLVTKLIELDNDCKKREIFSINSRYSLCIFNPEKETEKERKKIYRDDFLSDLFSWIGAAIGLAFIGGIIYMLITGK